MRVQTPNHPGPASADGHRCAASLPAGRCMATARWEVIDDGGCTIPVCMTHANAARRRGWLDVVDGIVPVQASLAFTS